MLCTARYGRSIWILLLLLFFSYSLCVFVVLLLSLSLSPAEHECTHSKNQRERVNMQNLEYHKQCEMNRESETVRLGPERERKQQKQPEPKFNLHYSVLHSSKRKDLLILDSSTSSKTAALPSFFWLSIHFQNSFFLYVSKETNREISQCLAECVAGYGIEQHKNAGNIQCFIAHHTECIKTFASFKITKRRKKRA